MRIIPKHPNYAATKSGQIWSYKTKKFLKPGRLNHRYLTVALCDNGIEKSRLVHHLVLETFVNSRPVGMECRHLDGNPQNNNLDNLKWGTHKENSDDRRLHGNCARTQLTEQVIRLIIYTYKTGLFTLKEVAKAFNTTYSNVHLIVKKKTWKHIWKGK